MREALALEIIGALWVAWFVYWMASAAGVKPSLWREPWRTQWRHRAPVWLAAWLLLAPRATPALLSRHFLPPSTLLEMMGIVLVAAGLGFAIWARLHLGRNWSGRVTIKNDHTLITTGPYVYVRHPIYTGILLAFLGTALALGEWRGIVALLLVLGALIVKSRIEEDRMRETFPDYEDYRRRTAALIPFVF